MKPSPAMSYAARLRIAKSGGKSCAHDMSACARVTRIESGVAPADSSAASFRSQVLACAEPVAAGLLDHKHGCALQADWRMCPSDT